ncbi:hypothetical protein CJU90_3852 [Yarrowia sp. C11]|nr:hypothetical protein CKK34_5463 [Yarrowia sp. E02]KAG5367553.1 hypothetical protein CJU90_3852 [Yarrowia sp. C11]
MQQPPPPGPGTPPIGPQRGSFPTFNTRHHPYAPPPPPHGQVPPQYMHNGYPYPIQYPPPQMYGHPPPYEVMGMGPHGVPVQYVSHYGYAPPPHHAPPPQPMYMYPHPPPVAVAAAPPPAAPGSGHFITGWKLDTLGLSQGEIAHMITYSSETDGVRDLRKDNLTMSNNWTCIFYSEDKSGQYTLPRQTANNLKHDLQIVIEAFKRGLTNTLEESYVFHDGQLKLDAKTGLFTSHWPKTVPSFATKDLVGKSVFTLSTSSPGKEWWNFQLQGDYKYITHTFSGRHSAALFESTTPDEQLTVYWVMINGKPSHINGATDWFWFQPKKFLPEERANEKVKLLLTGDPSRNLFLLASYTDDVHYIYLISRDPNSKTDRGNVTLIQVISNITRASPLAEPNVGSDEWCEFEIYTFASRMALYSNGRLAVFDVQLRPDGHIWSRVDLSKVGGIGTRTAPRQLGRYLVFDRVGALDMVTFGYREFEEDFCDGKFVVWSVREDKLVASYLDPIDSKGNVTGQLKDAFDVNVSQLSNAEWLRDSHSTREVVPQRGDTPKSAAIKRINFLYGPEVEVIEIS